MTTPCDPAGGIAVSGGRAGMPLMPDTVSAAIAGIVPVDPVPASTKAPAPSQILVLFVIPSPADERSGRPAPYRNMSPPRRAVRRAGRRRIHMAVAGIRPV